jgi:hypothetical protein
MGLILKLVLATAVVGALAAEVGSPVVARVQLDGVAHDVADDASRSIHRDGSRAAARARAGATAVDRGASLTRFQVRPDGEVEVSVAKEAPSYVLKRVPQVESWYDVEVDASSSVGSA